MEEHYSKSTDQCIKWRTLHEMSHDNLKKFSIRLENGEFFYAESILRLLPKKRMVVLGKFCKQTILAKLFFHPTKANHHLTKEVKGFKLLESYHIPTPMLLKSMKSEDGKVEIIFYEFLNNASNLKEVLNLPSTDPLLLLKKIITELTIQHVFGIKQKDLHLENFLITSTVIYTLDTASIVTNFSILPKKESMQHLALFLAQLDAKFTPLYQTLFEFYASLRGWITSTDDYPQLLKLINQHKQLRWREYLKKIFRQATAFKKINKLFLKGMVNRKYFSKALETILQSPEEMFKSQYAHYLKKGGSSTVILYPLKDNVIVVKRFNIKNINHFIRRMFRESRARTAWKMSNKMDLFGIPTAKPIAYVEKKCFGLPATSYFITAYLPGINANQFFKDPSINLSHKLLLIKKIIELLQSLFTINMTHGDLKLTNVIIQNNEPLLIDLDGTKNYSKMKPKYLIKDKKRLLKNFSDSPEFYQEIHQLLGI